jgi:zinc D-Ala-D-Ala carboxypeptidase
MKLSKNLDLSEVVKSQTATRLGINNTPPTQHINNLKLLAEKIFQPIRDHFKRPIFISSGYRSVALNRAIGGSLTSQHSTGEAIDIDMDGTRISNTSIFNYIKNNLDFDQLIAEFKGENGPAWIHVSYSASRPKQRKQILIALKEGNKTVYHSYTPELYKRIFG